MQVAINRITGLPEGTDTQVFSFTFSDLPVIQLAVSSDLSPEDLSAKLQSSTVVEIGKIDGVGDVSVLGAAEKRVTITPDPAKLFAAGPQHAVDP